MRILLVAFLFCLTSSIANAQVFQANKPLMCDKVITVFTALKEKYKEIPVWVADDIRDGTKYALFVNEKESTWTMLQFTTENACILGVGTGSTLPDMGNKI
jgi:hypothetical protein